jgi:hypothetical protein
LKTTAGRLNFVGGGGTYFMIIDTDGRAWLPQDRLVVYAGFGTKLQHYMLNSTERAIRGMLANDGRFPKGIVPDKEKWSLVLNGCRYAMMPKLESPWRDPTTLTKMNGLLKALSETSITISDKNGVEHTMPIHPDAPILGRLTAKLMTLDDLVVNDDEVLISYSKKGKTNEKKAVLIAQLDRRSNSRPAGKFLMSVLVTGKIKNMNGREITLIMDDLKLDEMLGYQTWTNDKEAKCWGSSVDRMSIMENYIKILSKSREMTVTLKPDASLFYNGVEGDLEDFSIGQHAGICLELEGKNSLLKVLDTFRVSNPDFKDKQEEK